MRRFLYLILWPGPGLFALHALKDPFAELDELFKALFFGHEIKVPLHRKTQTPPWTQKRQPEVILIGDQMSANKGNRDDRPRVSLIVSNLGQRVT